jgi:hypothetical protein
MPACHAHIYSSSALLACTLPPAMHTFRCLRTPCIYSSAPCSHMLLLPDSLSRTEPSAHHAHIKTFLRTPCSDPVQPCSHRLLPPHSLHSTLLLPAMSHIDCCSRLLTCSSGLPCSHRLLPPHSCSYTLSACHASHRPLPPHSLHLLLPCYAHIYRSLQTSAPTFTPCSHILHGFFCSSEAAFLTSRCRLAFLQVLPSHLADSFT